MLIAVKALRSSEMLAWQAERFGEPLDVLGLKEMEKPVPGPGEVLIKVRAVGLGLRDLMAVQGRYPLIHLPPAIPGHSFAGTIDSIGPGSPFTPDMRVTARTRADERGVGKECVRMCKSLCVPLPSENKRKK